MSVTAGWRCDSKGRSPPAATSSPATSRRPPATGTNCRIGWSSGDPPADPAPLRVGRFPPVQHVDEAPDAPPPGLGLPRRLDPIEDGVRSEEHTSELQSLMRISYAVFCLKKKTNYHHQT